MKKRPSFAIRKLRVEGPGKIPAKLSFAPGLNVIFGAANTGKSYVFEVLEYLFGSSHTPKETPHSVGYNRGILEIITSNGDNLTIDRLFNEDSVKLISRATDGVGQNSGETISAGHQKGDSTTLSAKLLKLCGFETHQILFSKKSGQKNEVSFRNVSWLAMVDEIRIQESRSPALSGDKLLVTLEKRLWNLMVTGEDDADLAAAPPSAKERNISIDAKIDLLKKYIEKKETLLNQANAGGEDLSVRLIKIGAALQESAAAVSENSFQLAELEGRRKDAWQVLVGVRDRRIVVEEHISRFKLLQTYYASDIARLKAVIEAGASFERLSSGFCAVCGGLPSPEHTVEGYASAAAAELEKVGKLAADLEIAIDDLKVENFQLIEEESLVMKEREQINEDIERVLKPRHSVTTDTLNELVKAKGDLDKAIGIRDELTEFGAVLARLELERKTKVPKAANPKQASAERVRAFCDVVVETLAAWLYPVSGRVMFNPEKFDLVLGDHHRGNMGKGIGLSLMRHLSWG